MSDVSDLKNEHLEPKVDEILERVRGSNQSTWIVAGVVIAALLVGKYLL